MVRASLWLQKTTPEQIVAVVPPEYYGDDKAGYAAALKKLRGALTRRPDDRGGRENVFEVLNAFEPSVKAAKIDLAKTFDNSFVQNALKKYK